MFLVSFLHRIPASVNLKIAKEELVSHISDIKDEIFYQMDSIDGMSTLIIERLFEVDNSSDELEVIQII